GGARVTVVAVERCAGDAGAALARLGAVADRAVRAGGAVGDGRVPAGEEGVAGVGRARVPVVAGGRGPGHARPALAGLGAVADGGVGARGAVGHCGEPAAQDGVAAIGRTRVAVVARERRAGRAHAVLARLGAVADGAVGTGGPVGNIRVLAARDG